MQDSKPDSPRSGRAQKWLQNGAFFLSGLILGALFLAYLRAGEIYDYSDTVDGVHLPPVDVIVTLAGGRGRMTAASDLWARYREKQPKTAVLTEPGVMLFASGLGGQMDFPKLKKLFRQGVQEWIQPKDVVLETVSSNTQENALFFIREAKRRGWTRILLVTSRYHMRRAVYMFDRIARLSGYPLTIETSSVYQEPFEPGEWRTQLQGVQVTLTEYTKWIYYRTFWRPQPSD